MFRRRKLDAALVASALIGLSLPASAAPVEVTGVAAVVDDDVPVARDRALDDAKRKAVEQIAGTQISAQSVSSNFELVEDTIYARASGFVRRYEVLDETREGDLYRVRISAEVDADAVTAKLDELFAVKPRVIVLVAEQNIGADRPSYWWGSSGAAADLSILQTSLIQAWQARGYTFVDPGLAAGELRITGPMKTAELSNEAARVLAADADADVAVVGKVLVNDAGPVMDGVKMHAYHAVGTLRVLSVDTGKILTVADDTGVAAHIDPNLGGRLAIKALTKKIGGQLDAVLMKRWVTESASSREIELVVEGVKTSRQARAIEKVLAEKVRGVESVQVRRRRKGKAFLTIKLKARAQDLARDMEAQTYGNFGLGVSEVSRSKIVASVERTK